MTKFTGPSGEIVIVEAVPTNVFSEIFGSPFDTETEAVKASYGIGGLAHSSKHPEPLSDGGCNPKCQLSLAKPTNCNGCSGLAKPKGPDCTKCSLRHTKPQHCGQCSGLD